MLSVSQRNDHTLVEPELLSDAVNLLSQQIWCWGRDIARPEGNWLLEIGFERIEPPANRETCSSVYTLVLPHDRCVVLRGFGVFFGDVQRGGVFLPRFEFGPQYTALGKLKHPPWSTSDLPKLKAPTETQRNACAMLTLDLIDWIWSYEVDIVERLGFEYRQSTLVQWKENKQPIVPAEEFAASWKLFARRLESEFESFIS